MTDLGYFLPNEFSDPDHILDQLTDPSFATFSMWEGGMVVAILCAKNYWGRNWMGFFLISSLLTPRLAVRLKKYIHEMMIRMDALRLQTDSIDCKVLNDWHEWLGFKWEGCREKMMNDRDYNCWALMRGGK